ncbi:MAG TPA: glycosyltransferase [Candidatus Baltobacteraceae bacterium]|nr:glycosyltransferase [Candidatus Baltobacteraceae bacterium]
MSGLVSIVIPTRNAAVYLKPTLDSVSVQTYPHVEVIVSDNGSTDETLSIAALYGCRVVKSGGERSIQLNEAIRAANGAYIYRIDADFILDPGVLEECVSLCQAGADAVSVHNDSSPSLGFWSRVRNLERMTYRNDDLIVGARFFRTEAIRRIGGFDEELVAGEDYDIHNRLIEAGYTMARSMRGEVHLGEPRSLGEIWSKSYYYGLTIHKYIQRHPKRAVAQLFPIRKSFLKHWRDLAAHPMLTVGIVVMMATKGIAAASAFVISTIGGRFRKRVDSPTRSA